jgi:hypothetical protein
MASRDRAGEARFLDVSYYDLMRAPLDEVERICAFVGRTLDDDVRRRVEASRKVDRQHKYGRHTYRLEDFGLSAASVEPNIARYRARFDIRHE